MRRVRGSRVSIIFQEPTSSLDPVMTVGDQLVEALRAHRPLRRAEARRQAAALLEAVGIAEPARRIRQYPFELSGGMCQRVMIATALAGKPAVLVADEPTTALDVTIQAQILALIKQIRARPGTAVLLITHDMGVVADVADRVLVMYAGRIVEAAPAEALFAAPRHPYTWLLLRSLPRLDGVPKARLPVIEGTVPAVGHRPAGCPFAPRCPLATTRCREADPALAASPRTGRSPAGTPIRWGGPRERAPRGAGAAGGVRGPGRRRSAAGARRSGPSTAWTSRSSPARRSASWARAAAARPRSETPSSASCVRPAAPWSSRARTSRGSTPTGSAALAVTCR